MPPTQTRPLTIGELSKLTGINLETIRYYEKIRLIPAPPRSRSGRRMYGTEERRLLFFVRRARGLGFTLDEIRTLLRLGGPHRAPCKEVRDIASRHVADIRAKISDLRRLDRVLSQTIAKCANGRSPKCPIIEVLDQEPAT